MHTNMLGKSIFCVYNNTVDYEFDWAKSESNFAKHGLWLAEVEAFEWETAIVHEDTRKRYEERRFVATGYVANRLHVMVYCLRSHAVRVISLRRANQREIKRYAEVET